MISQTISEKRWHNKTKITFDVKKRSPSLCLDGSGFHSNITGLVSHGDGKKKGDNARAEGLWQGLHSGFQSFGDQVTDTDTVIEGWGAQGKARFILLTPTSRRGTNFDAYEYLTGSYSGV